MTTALLGAFQTESDFLRAVEAARRQNLPIVDSFTPFLPEALSDQRGDHGPLRVTTALVAGGLAMAAAFYLVELVSATILYPFDSGGRAPDSFPAFMMGPFEFGVFSAGFCGFVALLVICRLPRPHQPLFAAPGVEHATQDRFLLALQPSDAADLLLREMGGLDVTRVEL